MLFHLFNILVIIEKYVNKILTKKLFYIFIIIYLNNIQIYIRNLGHLYIKTVCWVLDQL